MTGHGNGFNDADSNNLKNYLLAGGFLHIDDNYGMNQYIRKEIKKIFQIMSWLKYLQRTPFSKPYSSQMDYQKFMNTMENDHKLLVFYS
jgi:hypothetical protein